MNTNQQENDPKSRVSANSICKLGLDVHAASIMVARQWNNSQPQPPQRFTGSKFLSWVAELVKQGHRVISCYEAGPTGYWLHRQLAALGVTNYVVCPTKLDSRGKGVNTDQTDAIELLVRLDRYVAGNGKSFSVVRVPTPEQERKRSLSRQRDQLRRKRQSIAAQGRLLLLGQGYRQSNSWWQKTRWAKLQSEVPAWLAERLAVFRRVLEFLQKEVEQLTASVSQAAPESLPMGMGALTHEVLESEIKDWQLFGNRRQVGSYSGLTGGVSASGEKSADLSITKAGNRRLSCCLIECAWRMVAWQPDYWLVKKWSRVLLNGKVHVRRRKQAIVAFARQLLIDVWKWKTGRATPQSLGWRMT